MTDDFGDNAESQLSPKACRGIFPVSGTSGVEPVQLRQVLDETSKTALT